MTWLVHATRDWSDGQVFVAVFFVITGALMAARTAALILVRRAQRRWHPAIRPPRSHVREAS